MREPWIKWAMLEAISRASSRLLQKTIGVTSSVIGHTFFAALLVGIVQVTVGLVATLSRKKKLFDNTANVIGSISFGILAYIATVLGFVVFMLNGEVGVSTFIVGLSIIPGALIDRIFFGHSLNMRQCLGILVAILAGYTVLNAPSLHEIKVLPLWVWLSVLNMLAVAVNQGITQKIKSIDPFVKNFWGGLTAIVLGVISLLFVPLEAITKYPALPNLIGVSLLVGVMVIFIWSFNLLSYKGGAYITLKKIITNGSYLILSMFAGFLFFHESMTVLKVIGVILYILAFMMVDTVTWNRLFGPKTPSKLRASH